MERGLFSSAWIRIKSQLSSGQSVWIVIEHRYIVHNCKRLSQPNIYCRHLCPMQQTKQNRFIVTFRSVAINCWSLIEFNPNSIALRWRAFSVRNFFFWFVCFSITCRDWSALSQFNDSLHFFVFFFFLFVLNELTMESNQCDIDVINHMWSVFRQHRSHSYEWNWWDIDNPLDQIANCI